MVWPSESVVDDGILPASGVNVYGHTQDLKSFFVISPVQIGQKRILLAARTAPASPELQNHILSAQVGQFYSVSFDSSDFEIGGKITGTKPGLPVFPDTKQ